MSVKNLTKKEQDTLWGLINHPILNDKELAKKIHLKLSTVTAIRRRLRDKGYYWTVNIPDFYRLGYELLSVEYGTFNEAVPVGNRVEHFSNFVENNPNTIFSIMSRSTGLLFNVAKNYAEANTNFEDLELYLTSHHLTDEAGWKRVIFPFQTSFFWNFFDFSPVFRYSYDIKRKFNLQEYSPIKENEIVRLSKKEKAVLFGLVKYPEHSDNSIADKFKISRQAVSNIKKRFIKEDLLSTRRILNFDHSGCTLLAFSYAFFGTRAPIHTRSEGLDYTMKSAPTIVGISSNFENVLFAAIKNYNEYEKMREKILSFYKTHQSMVRDPEVMLFPVEDIRYCKNPTFYQLLEDQLGIEDD
jgi:DNA-binding MarR family transcriptional regulator